MAKPAAKDYRRAGVAAPDAPEPLGDRWYAKVGLLLLGVALLSLSFAPFGQFYLAWVGLVPWLLVLRRVKSRRAAFLWSWLGGILYFTANMWWLWNVTGPGMVALMFLLGLYWAVAAVILRGAGLLHAIDRGDSTSPPAPLTRSPLAAVLLIAAVWVSLERLRPAAMAVAAMVGVALGYGLYRMSESQCLRPGPTVMVVQPNYPQSNT